MESPKILRVTSLSAETKCLGILGSYSYGTPTRQVSWSDKRQPALGVGPSNRNSILDIVPDAFLIPAKRITRNSDYIDFLSCPLHSLNAYMDRLKSTIWSQNLSEDGKKEWARNALVAGRRSCQLWDDCPFFQFCAVERAALSNCLVSYYK